MHRKLVLMAAVAVAAGCGGTGEHRTGASPSPATGTTMGGAFASPATGITGATSGEFAAEIVSVDTAARTVTLRESAVGGTAGTMASPATRTGTGSTGTTGATAPGGTTTLRVEGTAGDMMRDFKTGDRVVVSCTMGGGSAVGGTGGTAGTTGGSTGTTGTTSGSTAGTTGTTGAGGMGTTGATTGTTGGTGTGGYATTGGSMSAGTLAGCTSVTAIRKAS